jgi:hypothetical protein
MYPENGESVCTSQAVLVYISCVVSALYYAMQCMAGLVDINLSPPQWGPVLYHIVPRYG